MLFIIAMLVPQTALPSPTSMRLQFTAIANQGKDAFMTAPPLSAAKMAFFVAKAKLGLVEGEPLVTAIGMTL